MSEIGKYEEYEGEYITVSSEDDDCLRAIKDSIRDLPMAERMIMVMYVEAGTYSEVAKHLRCSVPTVSKRIKAIKAKLGRKVETVCGSL